MVETVEPKGASGNSELTFKTSTHITRLKLLRLVTVSAVAVLLKVLSSSKCRFVVEDCQSTRKSSLYKIETRHMPKYLLPAKNTTLMEPKIWERKEKQLSTQDILEVTRHEVDVEPVLVGLV